MARGGPRERGTGDGNLPREAVKRCVVRRDRGASVVLRKRSIGRRDRGTRVALRTRSCFFDALTVPNTDMQRKKGGYGAVLGLDGLDRSRFPGWRDGNAVDTTSPTIPSTKGYPDRIICREGLRADPAGIGCAADGASAKGWRSAENVV